MWIKDKRFVIETTVQSVYDIGDDILGIRTNPTPHELRHFYFGTVYGYYFRNCKQNNDLYLKKNHLHYDLFKDILNPGTSLKITYDIVLCKYFGDDVDEEDDLKVGDNLYVDDDLKIGAGDCKDGGDSDDHQPRKSFSFGKIYKNYKLKRSNSKKRMYDNYVVDIEHCPIYKEIMGVVNIVKYDKDYFEIDPDEYFACRFLIHKDDVNLLTIKDAYTIYFQKRGHPSNYYLITKVIEL